ncbi:MAG: rhodanese-like domain-containing protein [Gemmatimonadota bacterium]
MSTATTAISTAALVERLADPAHTVIDVRPLAAFNGWPLAGEERGGHLPGAVSLPLQWTRYVDWVEAVEAKGLDTGRPVTLYGYTGEDARGMAGKLGRLGFSQVDVYDGFLDEWVADPELPLQRLERYRQLVHPAWLQERLDGEGGPLVLCHAHFDNPPDYEKGHIPGAVALDTNTLESPEDWNRRSPEELEAALLALGIRHDSTVVLYGRYSHPTNEQPEPGQSAGHLAAMRCALLMLYAGVEDVRVLNGGIHSWEEAGHALSSEATRPVPARDFGRQIPAHPEFVVDAPDARRLIAAADGELVSVRSWREFIGEVSGYHYVEKKGRIPGAIFGNCGSDAYHMENYRNLDHTMRAFPEVAALWAEAGITPDKHIAFYCGTGWRASEAFMNTYLMGWPRISIYDEGWYGWSSDPANPIETGVPD